MTYIVGSKMTELGWVYAIEAEMTEDSHRVKIGYTCGRPEERLNALQTGSPTPLRLLGAGRGRFQDEKRLHRRFSAQRLHREWFSLTQSELAELLAALTEMNRETDADRLKRLAREEAAQREEALREAVVQVQRFVCNQIGVDGDRPIPSVSRLHSHDLRRVAGNAINAGRERLAFLLETLEWHAEHIDEMMA